MSLKIPALLLSIYFLFGDVHGASDSQIPTPKRWVHAEYAAGNYGRSIRNFNFLFRKNYEILYQTLDQLFAAHAGPLLIYVNDWNDSWAQLAASSLQDYARQRYPKESIEIRVLTGDVLTMEMPAVHSAHLKNPDVYLLGKLKQINFLQKMADHSITGLELTGLDSAFYKYEGLHGIKFTYSGPGLDYIFPAGLHVPSTTFKVNRKIPFENVDSVVWGRSIEEYRPARGIRATCRWVLEHLMIPIW